MTSISSAPEDGPSALSRDADATARGRPHTAPLEDRAASVIARIPEWKGLNPRATLAAAPVASPIHRAVASDCLRVTLDGADPVFLKLPHSDMAGDVLPGMARAAAQAGRLGIGPEVRVSGDGYLGLAYLAEPWRYARVGDLHDRDAMARVLGTVKRLHRAKALGWRFCPFARIAALAEEARACAAPLPGDIAHHLAVVDRIREAVRAAGFDLAFCRNDGVASNVMLGGDGVQLVDFDLAGDNDPWFDVAALINEACVFDDERRNAIAAYAGTCDETVFNRCRLYGAVDDLMWGLWGVARAITSPRIGIDFLKYGQWRLLHARTTLDSPEIETWLHRL